MMKLNRRTIFNAGTRLSVPIIAVSILAACQSQPSKETAQEGQSMQNIRVATFNVSMEATNYQTDRSAKPSLKTLIDALASGNNQQIKNIAEIIQRTRPNIILLNEFDYVANPKVGIEQFISGYLQQSQNGQAPINYPHIYLAPVNTGVKTGLSGDSVKLSHYGFGKYAGQYGMVLLSQFPIDSSNARTFQKFLWRDMPNNLLPVDASGASWYAKNEVDIMRLSSKSHWDLPVDVCGTTIHVLASHPTPPVFDGPEDRNGRRNHDELRFWRDYIEGNANSYHYDDLNTSGGIQDNNPFIILGDLNASSVEGDGHPNAVAQLLQHTKIAKYPAPESDGGKANKPDNPYAASHTAGWGMRADYVLPSSDMTVTASGVFWPSSAEDTSYLVADRRASSDHRLVWADISLPAKANSATNNTPECNK